jgi:hypothetical protein
MYQINVYHAWIPFSFIPPPFSFICLHLHSRNSFNRYFFLFAFICIQYLYHIHSLIPFPHLLPLSLVSTPQAGNIFKQSKKVH